MSIADATEFAREIALEFAKRKGIEGTLLTVTPDNMIFEKRGKVPVYWTAVFETVLNGAVFDGPTVFAINLETKDVAPFSAP